MVMQGMDDMPKCPSWVAIGACPKHQESIGGISWCQVGAYVFVMHVRIAGLHVRGKLGRQSKAVTEGGALSGHDG